MQIEITLTAEEIKEAIADYLLRLHPELMNQYQVEDVMRLCENTKLIVRELLIRLGDRDPKSPKEDLALTFSACDLKDPLE